MTCLIVDDEDMSRSIVQHFVEQTNFLSLVQSCPDAIQAANVLQQTPVDVLFLDIEMPHMSGMELVKSLQVKPQVIFITSRADYAVEAFEYNVTDYLVKPITYARFLKAVTKAKELFDAQQPVQLYAKDLYIKTDSKIVKIHLKDLLYVEALADYVMFYTANGSRHVVHSTMKGVEKRLSSGGFMRVHRSFIINIEKIESIEDLSIIINKKLIPIGASYKDGFLKKLNIL
ncbi:LytTR family DNA-binding domain-containing protein [Rhodocytophaga aerolata]|uniref:LytTR family DNA-binding domain-containing protein n=1 Tax=Rhodocytophaga aerolata TaxID=455078 RepID=A0ABT8RAF0_9BACT|nr:LytTR family DNA-binding domain-containing protein [Rhodocytophaga aerolata]MDO1449071.1 LytTR family DNA-binding domain-containing protein [Rhodocytophaga aerolata]